MIINRDLIIIYNGLGLAGACRNGIYDVANIFYAGAVKVQDCTGTAGIQHQIQNRTACSCNVLVVSPAANAAGRHSTGHASCREAGLSHAYEFSYYFTLPDGSEKHDCASVRIDERDAGGAYKVKMAVYRMLKAWAAVECSGAGKRAGAGNGSIAGGDARGSAGGDAGAGNDCGDARVNTGGDAGADNDCGDARGSAGGDAGAAFPPWGALVGIRPVKLYADLINKGYSEADAISYMADKYDVPEKASRLCLGISELQRGYLSQCDNGIDFMLYIGVPFCRTKCAYCSFPSDAHNKADIYAPRYIDALLRELRFIGACTKASGRRLRAIYIGGGTPTALGSPELARLLYGVADTFAGDVPEEITVEAGRADTIDREKLIIIKENPCRARRLRLCINPQTMNQRTLKLIGRDHTPEEVVSAFRLAREIGFGDINMDIIAGLPLETAHDFEGTLASIAELAPDSFTSHTLCIKRSSRMNEHRGEFGHPGTGEIEAMRDLAERFALSMGMAPYYLYRQKNTVGNFENIGYAKKGGACIYNIHEMADSLDVLAAGAGAVSKICGAGTGRIDRVFNVKNLLEYISRVDEMIKRKSGYLTGERKMTSNGGRNEPGY